MAVVDRLVLAAPRTDDQLKASAAAGRVVPEGEAAGIAAAVGAIEARNSREQR